MSHHNSQHTSNTKLPLRLNTRPHGKKCDPGYKHVYSSMQNADVDTTSIKLSAVALSFVQRLEQEHPNYKYRVSTHGKLWLASVCPILPIPTEMIPLSYLRWETLIENDLAKPDRFPMTAIYKARHRLKIYGLRSIPLCECMRKSTCQKGFDCACCMLQHPWWFCSTWATFFKSFWCLKLKTPLQCLSRQNVSIHIIEVNCCLLCLHGSWGWQIQSNKLIIFALIYYGDLQTRLFNCQYVISVK